MTIKMPRNLMTAVSVVAFAVLLQGCGGGGGSSPVATMDDDTPPTTPPTTIMGQIIPSGTTLTLPPGHGLQEGTIRAKMGQTITFRDDDGNVIVSGTCGTDVGCSADLTGDEVTIVGDVELLEANALVLALLTDLLPPDPADLNEIETAQAAAMTAATAAQTAADAATMAAEAADAANDNRATIQTGDLTADNSDELAYAAKKQAEAAATAAAAAQAASDAAAAAMDITTAVEAKIHAENAQAAAEEAQMMAEEQRDAALAVAAAEVKVDDKTKTVGGTSITIDDDANVVTRNDETTKTGLLEGEEIMTTGDPITPVNEVLEDEGTDAIEAAAAITGAAQRSDLEVGVVYDSADDTARLVLVHSYAGTKTVIAFADGTDGTVTRTGAKATTIDHDGITTNDEIPVKAATGAFFEADALTVVDAEDVAGTIGADEKAHTKIYYYEDGGEKTYVRRVSEVENQDGETTWNYQVINIRTGAKIPAAAPYTHLHFGVWAGLEEAAKNGTNNIADLGIGFVTALAGGTGMTDDMPNNGSAKYNGNWVANVQAEDAAGSGAITLQDGAAEIKANFGKDEVGITLTGLATLDGAIAGNTFSGTKATVMPDAATEGGLDVDGKFEGSFEGAFFGSKAAEAGGVFAYTSKDNKAGAFTGAFGGDRTDD